MKKISIALAIIVAAILSSCGTMATAVEKGSPLEAGKQYVVYRVFGPEKVILDNEEYVPLGFEIGVTGPGTTAYAGSSSGQLQTFEMPFNSFTIVELNPDSYIICKRIYLS